MHPQDRLWAEGCLRASVVSDSRQFCARIPTAQKSGTSGLGTMAHAAPASPSKTSPSTLRLPVQGLGMTGSSSMTELPRRSQLSPLLEVRRPYCTLNCDSCSAVLGERFKLSECSSKKKKKKNYREMHFILSKMIYYHIIFLNLL